MDPTSAVHATSSTTLPNNPMPNAKQKESQDTKDMVQAIASLVHFCTDINIGTAPKSGYFIKALVCNLQYIKQETLYERIFGNSSESYVSWDIVENLHKRFMSKRKSNPIGGVAVWHFLFFFLSADLPKFQEQHHSCKQLYRPFYIVYDACVSEFADTGATLEFIVVVRIFLMINLIGIQAVHAIPVILGDFHQQLREWVDNIQVRSQNLTLKILGERFTPEQYTDTIAWLIKSGIVGEFQGERA